MRLYALCLYGVNGPNLLSNYERLSKEKTKMKEDEEEKTNLCVRALPLLRSPV